MADNLSDTQIRANLRSVLAESGIDPNRTAYVCTGGTVRLLGDLMGIRDTPVRPAQIDVLEESIKRSKGVTRVHLNINNFKQLPSGQWEPVEVVSKRKSGVREDSEED